MAPSFAFIYVTISISHEQESSGSSVLSSHEACSFWLMKLSITHERVSTLFSLQQFAKEFQASALAHSKKKLYAWSRWIQWLEESLSSNFFNSIIIKLTRNYRNEYYFRSLQRKFYLYFIEFYNLCLGTYLYLPLNTGPKCLLQIISVYNFF
jgi:hypothetical protein